METYHKIQTLFKRHLDGPKKGKMIRGAWTTPALEYLADNKWEFTEKVDGTNIRIGWNHKYTAAGSNWYKEVEFGGRTDRAVLPKPLEAYLHETFTPEKMGEHFTYGKDGAQVVLYGEGYGVDIQSGGNYRDDQSFVLFDVNIGGWWLQREDVDDIARKLGIDSVPVLGYGTLHDAIEIVSSGLTWDSAGKMTKWHGGSVKKGLRSTWGDFEAEGIVARTATPLFDRRGERMITKIKAVDFR